MDEVGPPPPLSGAVANGAPKRSPERRRPHTIAGDGFEIGSDVDVARRLIAGLRAEFTDAVFCQGGIHVWQDTHWARLRDCDLRRRVHTFDGLPIAADGRDRVLKLTKSKINSILNEAAAIIDEAAFFDAPPIGINCRSGFITISAIGGIRLLPHQMSQRQQHLLPIDWDRRAPSDPPAGSWLARYRDGCFGGTEDAAEKFNLVGQLAAAALLGLATRLKAPKAALLYGPKANNGKSTTLELLRALLPPEAVCCLPPDKFDDRDSRATLTGKRLNAADETGGGAIAGDMLKAAITGDRLQARRVYARTVEFSPVALHVFAANALPAFRSGVDNGLKRRLLVLPFDRVVTDQVPDLVERIVGEEGPLLLSFVLARACDLVLRGDFQEPPSCRRALMEWLSGSDPILAFLNDDEEVEVTGSAHDEVPKKALFAAFQRWTKLAGYRDASIPDRNTFSRRVANSGMPGLVEIRTAKGRNFRGIRLHSAPRSTDASMT